MLENPRLHIVHFVFRSMQQVNGLSIYPPVLTYTRRTLKASKSSKTLLIEPVKSASLEDKLRTPNHHSLEKVVRRGARATSSDIKLRFLSTVVETVIPSEFARRSSLNDKGRDEAPTWLMGGDWV